MSRAAAVLGGTIALLLAAILVVLVLLLVRPPAPAIEFPAAEPDPVEVLCRDQAGSGYLSYSRYQECVRDAYLDEP